MTARIASGRTLLPSLMAGQAMPLGPNLPFTPEMLAVPREGMFRVVNGSGTAAASKIQIGDVRMAGKTGTAQVRALGARNAIGEWKTRDHSLFIAFAPADAPRYAMSVVVEHGTFGARAAAPIAKDVMTMLFDPRTAWDTLLKLETQWGGTASERLAAKFKAYAARYGTSAPKVGPDGAVQAAMERTPAPAPAVDTPNQDVITPADTPRAPDPAPTGAPAPAPTPTAGPEPH